jgi:hypothetical protein
MLVGHTLKTAPVKGKIAAHADSRCHYGRVSALLAFALYSVVHATQALAGDHSSVTDSALKEGAGNFRNSRGSAAAIFAAPFVFAKPLKEVEAFSATDFRPRKRGLDVDPSSGGRPVIDAPMLPSSSLSQQLGELRSANRVRLLTLWQTRGSSLSLQAGRHGAPSLQWTSPWVHREGPARGLFDRLPRWVGATGN